MTPGRFDRRLFISPRSSSAVNFLSLSLRATWRDAGETYLRDYEYKIGRDAVRIPARTVEKLYARIGCGARVGAHRERPARRFCASSSATPE